MALINCPRCGKPISSSAVACPHCGFRPGVDKLQYNNYTQQANSNTVYSPQTPNPQNAVNAPTPLAEQGNAVGNEFISGAPVDSASNNCQPQTTDANSQISQSNTPVQTAQTPLYAQPQQPNIYQNYTYNQPTEKPKKKKTALFAGILAGLLTLSAAGWYFLVPQTFTALNTDNSYIELIRLGSKYTQDYGDGDILSGTYTTNGTTITMQPVNDSSYSYTKYKNFLLNGEYELFDGSLSSNALFDATISKDYEYTSSNGKDTYILFMYIFEASGKCSYGLAIYYNDVISSQTISYGTYTVNDGKVTISYTSGDKAGESAYLVYDGYLIYSGVYEK